MRLTRKIIVLSLLLASPFIWMAGPAFSQTLKAVKARGQLVCGVSEGIVGFSAKSATGEWNGFDVDFCRAVAAAIFDDHALEHVVDAFLWEAEIDAGLSIDLSFALVVRDATAEQHHLADGQFGGTWPRLRPRRSPWPRLRRPRSPSPRASRSPSP